MPDAQPPARRPNVIWIFGDQHRGQALSAAGDPNLSTPHLDRMAAEGAHFPNAVGGFPLCCPFRGSLLAGRYPHLCVPGHEYPLPAGMPTIAAPLAEAGYQTAYFGKWHLAGFREREGRSALRTVPRDARGGFDAWIGYDNNNSQWDSWVHGHDAGGGEVPHCRLPGYETDCLADMLIDYVRGRAAAQRGGTEAAADARPFFAVLSVQPPHDPYLAPADWMARHRAGHIELRANVPPIERVRRQASRDLAGYYAQIENLDHNVGRVRSAVAEAGIADDTYILFFSDHGDMHGSHGQFRKTSPYAESLSIPFVIAGGQPFYRHRASRHAFPVNHVDIAPTTLGLCGLTSPDWMAGVDCSGLFVKGRPAPTLPDSAYIQAVVPTGHHHSVDRPWRGVVTADGWKYVVLEHQPWMLFNLNEDPYELANHAFNSACAAERRRLHERLAQWIADTADPFPLPAL